MTMMKDSFLGIFSKTVQPLADLHRPTLTHTHKYKIHKQAQRSYTGTKAKNNLSKIN